MAAGLTERIAVTDLSSMSVKEVCDHHRDLLVQIRCVDHWRRLISARLDLAVAAVADLDELCDQHVGNPAECAPPNGLRGLLGIPCSGDRLAETALLPHLRRALAELDSYKRSLRDQADEAGHVLATRFDRSADATTSF